MLKKNATIILLMLVTYFVDNNFYTNFQEPIRLFDMFVIISIFSGTIFIIRPPFLFGYTEGNNN